MKGKIGTATHYAGAFWRGCDLPKSRPPGMSKSFDYNKSVRAQQAGYLRRNSAKNVTLPKLKFMGDDV